MKTSVHVLKDYIRGISDYLSGEAADFGTLSYKISTDKPDAENRDQIKYAMYEADELIRVMNRYRDQLQDLVEVENIEAKESSGK